MVTNVYVDGFNLYYGCLRGSPYRWLDLDRLCRRLFPRNSAIVITNDSDLKEPVELVQRELGIRIGIVNPHPASRRSRALQPTFFRQIRPKDLQACQFAAVLSDARGAIRKPPGW